MRKVVFAINITADGFCSHTDGIADEELHDFFAGLLRNAGIILFGRITYQLLASQLSVRGLIDEYHFVVHPVIAGKGPRLFDTVKPQERLLLDFIGLKAFQSGVVAHHYKKHA